MRRRVVALALAGCVPHVTVTSLGEPDVELPPGVRVLAAAGEGEAGEAAARAFGEALGSSPRMRAGEPADATVTFGPFEASSRDEASSRLEADGEQGEEEPSEVFGARRTVVVRGVITLAAADGRVLERLDGVGTRDVWEVEGATAAEAEAALPSVEELAVELGASAGAAYARRVAPLWVRTTRAWYPGGDPRMRAVAWTARAGDWTAARRAWSEVANDDSASDRARARALHDLAVAHELDGDLHRAAGLARRAADLAPTRRIEEYRDVLEALRAQHRPLLDDIALPGEAPAQERATGADEPVHEAGGGGDG